MTDDTSDRSLPMDHEPLNRAERRAKRFRPQAGQPDPHAVGGGAVPDESLAGEGDDAEAFAKRGSGDVTRLTGAGTGGATESEGRVTHHEGVHLGNQPNG
jgi:hypothetical protein